MSTDDKVTESTLTKGNAIKTLTGQIADVFTVIRGVHYVTTNVISPSKQQT